MKRGDRDYSVVAFMVLGSILPANFLNFRFKKRELCNPRCKLCLPQNSYLKRNANSNTEFKQRIKPNENINN